MEKIFPTTLLNMKISKNKGFPVKRVFVSKDGIWKDFPLTRTQSISSIFLTEKEKILFILGFFPRRWEKVLLDLGIEPQVPLRIFSVREEKDKEFHFDFDVCKAETLIIFENKLLYFLDSRTCFGDDFIVKIL